MDWKTDPDLGGKFLNWGKHRGSCFADLPVRYIRWLAMPIITDRVTKTKKRVDVPDHIVAIAKTIMDSIEREARDQVNGKELYYGKSHAGPDPLYYIEYCGDVRHRHAPSLHKTMDAALEELERIYPLREEAEDGVGEVFTFRETPDPEADQIIMWEILPSGHRRIVWHFTGFHEQEEGMSPQGRLPGDNEDLYSLAMRDQ